MYSFFIAYNIQLLRPSEFEFQKQFGYVGSLNSQNKLEYCIQRRNNTKHMTIPTTTSVVTSSIETSAVKGSPLSYPLH